MFVVVGVGIGLAAFAVGFFFGTAHGVSEEQYRVELRARRLR